MYAEYEWRQIVTPASGSADTKTALHSPLAIIAGAGSLPFAVAESLRKRDIEPVFFALKGFCDSAKVSAYRHHWIPIGQFGRLMAQMRAEGCRDIVFIGGVVRPALSEVRLDWATIKLIPNIIAGLRGGDDHTLKATAQIFERGGFRMLGVAGVAPDLLMPDGALTRATPSDSERNDIAKAEDLLRAMSPFDIGQAAVVIGGHVVGVEDVEGTDALLARVARLRDEGRIRGKQKQGVLVKAPKIGQDLRFDLPALGPPTVDGVIAAGLAGIAVTAGQSVVAEPQALVERADSAGIFIIGLPA